MNVKEAMKNGLELWPLLAQKRPGTPMPSEGTNAVIMLLFGQTSLLTALLVVVLFGSERIYQRMLEMIRVVRGDGASQGGTTPPCRDAELTNGRCTAMCGVSSAVRDAELPCSKFAESGQVSPDL